MSSDGIIAGRYRLDKRIGSGAMGIVWRATDLELGRVVALKQSRVGDSGQIRREARIGAGLHHPHVVTVFDVVLDGDDRWLVMEYLPSRSLSAVLREDGSLSPIGAARIGVQIAGALVAMHERGMVHRDIKPGNVLVAEDGTAKLTDLGITRWSEVTVTGSMQLAGTPGYIAPEVADGHEAGRPADLYSLGATLFTAVEGFSPTGDGEQGPYAQLRRAIAGELDSAVHAGPLAPVLTELLRRVPAERPSARKAKDLLDAIVGDPVAVTSFPKPKRRVSRRFALVLGAAAVAVIAVAVGSVYLFRGSPAVVVAGLVGDPRTADPCSLIDPDSGKQFGPLAVLDSEYGEFNRCGMVIKLSQDDADLVDTWLEIQEPPRYPSVPHTPGRLGQVERSPETRGRCQRSVRLPDGNQIVVTARHKDERPAPLCAIAETLTSDAYAILSRGEIPRRAAPFPGDSLARLDACAMLDDADLTREIGVTGARPDPAFANWKCHWEQGQVEAELSFTRDWSLEPESWDEKDGKLIKIGARDAVVKTQKASDDNSDECVVSVVNRDYQKETAAWNNDWIELAAVTVETDRDSPEALCAKATALARAVVARLPS